MALPSLLQLFGFAGLSIGGIALCVWYAKRRMLKKNTSLRVTNFKQNVVYLFNFPSSRSIVSISPFALKVETWLRVNKIEHETIRKRFVWSRKGQIPFVELNGEELNESNLILRALQKHFGTDDLLSDEQLGQARALEMMLEHRTALSYFHYRYAEATKEFVATWEFTNSLLRRFLRFQFPRAFKNRVQCHGIGRGGIDEMHALGCSDIQALADFLGNKKFLFGDRMTTADCYAFGHLAQILYVPVDYPHKRYMRERTPLLCDYVERIKKDVWPDWDEICLAFLQGSE